MSENDFKTSSSGVNLTPFIWDYLGTEFNMKLASGFAGATITDDGYIMPQLGWAVINEGQKLDGLSNQGKVY